MISKTIPALLLPFLCACGLPPAQKTSVYDDPWIKIRGAVSIRNAPLESAPVGLCRVVESGQLEKLPHVRAMITDRDGWFELTANYSLLRNFRYVAVCVSNEDGVIQHYSIIDENRLPETPKTGQIILIEFFDSVN